MVCLLFEKSFLKKKLGGGACKYTTLTGTTSSSGGGGAGGSWFKYITPESSWIPINGECGALWNLYVGFGPNG